METSYFFISFSSYELSFFLVQVFFSDQYFFEIVLFFAVTFQKYEKKKSVFSYEFHTFYTWNDFSTLFQGLKRMGLLF